MKNKRKNGATVNAAIRRAELAEQQRDKLLAALKEASAEIKGLPRSLGGYYIYITHHPRYDAIIAEVEASK